MVTTARELINRVESKQAAYTARIRLGLKEGHPPELLRENDRIACVLNDLKNELENLVTKNGQ